MSSDGTSAYVNGTFLPGFELTDDDLNAFGSDIEASFAVAPFVSLAAGSVSRPTNAKLSETISLADFIGVGATSAANSAALLAAATYASSLGGATVNIPPRAGGWLFDPIVFSGLFNVTLRGAGNQSTKVWLATAPSGTSNTLFTFTDCINPVVADMQISPLGALTNPTTGILFNGSTGNGRITGNWIVGFNNSGVRLIGTSTVTLSGHRVRDNLFLANTGADGQLYCYYSNDFKIGLNQFGWTGITHPAIGCQLSYSSAGTYTENYHWENVVGLKAVNCGHNKIIANRIEENAHEGAILTSCYNTLFSENLMYANSKNNSGAYDNFVMTGCAMMIVTENEAYDWTGGAQPHRYSYVFGAGNTAVQWRDNKAAGYSAGPYNVDASNALQINGDQTLSFMSSTNIAGGSTVYLGANGSQTTETFTSAPVGRRCAAVALYAASVSVPGAGQSYSFTLRRTLADVALTAAFAGTGGFEVSNAGVGILYAVNDTICVKAVTSATATASALRVSLVLLDY